ncbi:MAG: leucyl aminopeptidase family protein [Sphingobium sp.]
MTNFTDLLKPDNNQPARTIHLVDAAGFDTWLATQSETTRALLRAQKFKGGENETAILPGDEPGDWWVAAGVARLGALSPWCLARAAETLPEGAYRLDDTAAGPAMLGWLTAQYRFDRYRKGERTTGPRVLLTGEVARIAPTIRMAEAVALVRDLINTPAADMGPAELEEETRRVGARHGAQVDVVAGEALAEGFPMIHAVGRAADRAFAPRLIELTWGDPAHPRVAIIGKGISFDSGGLDMKPSAAMRLMKKDMGGAAHALGLAQLVMGADLPIRMHLLIPAAENAIGGASFRPGDILASRKGLTVEIGNTDAEGRLVLADALVRAAEEAPELILDFATLTGAARVALGPDLPAMFANDESLADDMAAAAEKVADPLWRLPLWDGYAEMLKSDIADINNAGEGGFAGAVTAALFLRRFLPDGCPWVHLDTFAWRAVGKPGRPKGGEALGLRTAFAMLNHRYGLIS